jgi:GPH family glycoside/pentoside/hexuronide:cation symporter
MEKHPLIDGETIDSSASMLTPQPLTFKQKFIYGIAETGVCAVSNMVGFFLSTFLLEVAGVEPYLAGNIMLVGHVFDAFAHPIIGKISDNTRTRWGRRRPWIMLGAIPYSIGYFALWQVLNTENQAVLFMYYFGILISLSVFGTFIDVPFTAMTPELATTYDEATELTTYRQIGCLTWNIITSFTHTVIIQQFKSESDPTVIDYRKGYFYSGIAIAIAILPQPIIFAACIKEKPLMEITPAVVATETDPLLRRAWSGTLSIITIFKNRAFFMAMMVYFLCWVSVMFLQNNLLLYMKYTLNLETHFQWFIVVMQGVGALSTIMWAQVSAKIGKQKTYYIGAIVFMLTLLSTWFLPEAPHIAFLYGVAAFCGLGYGIGVLIPWSFLPDIIGQDELETGLKREGVFYAIFVLFQRGGLAMSVAVSSYILGFAGYINPQYGSGHGNEGQPETVELALKVLVGPIPATLLLLSFIFVSFYPLSKAKVEEIHRLLAQKRSKEQQQRL